MLLPLVLQSWFLLSVLSDIWCCFFWYVHIFYSRKKLNAVNVSLYVSVKLFWELCHLQFHMSSQGAAGAAVQYLGYTPGLSIVGLFAIWTLWMYANFWITSTLFIIGGMSWFLGWLMLNLEDTMILFLHSFIFIEFFQNMAF